MERNSNKWRESVNDIAVKYSKMPLDEKRLAFVNKAIEVSNAAYEMMEMWEGEFADELHSSDAILKAYPLPLSFDEWWMSWSNFIDVLKVELKLEEVI